jgi:hypothetical protein
MEGLQEEINRYHPLGKLKQLIKLLTLNREIMNSMKGITFITDETHKKRFVQIDLEQLEKYQHEIEDLLDVIIAESRKNDEQVSWEEIKAQLKAEGKL